MRSSWIFTFLLLTLVFSSLRAQSTSNLTSPRASVITSLLHSPYSSSSTKRTATRPPQSVIEWTAKDQDSGFLETGTSFKTNYKFTNTGEKILEIRGVNCNCNGATVRIPDQIVQPGHDGVIKVSLTRNLGGPFFCYLSVLSNTQDLVDVLTLSGVAFQAD